MLTARCVSHALKDASGAPLVYQAGEVVIAGYWFQWCGERAPKNYELWDEVWAANTHNIPDFDLWDGAPRVVVLASDVRRRAIALKPLASRSRNQSQARTIRRYELDDDTLEQLEKDFAC